MASWFLGQRLAAALGGLASPTAGLILVAAYILLLSRDDAGDVQRVFREY